MKAIKSRKFDIDDRDLWVRCEVAVGLWLEANADLNVDWTNGRDEPTESKRVSRLTKLAGPPMVEVGGVPSRRPDFKTVDSAGRQEWWEVKQRAAAWRDEADGTSCFWVAQDALDDYVRIATDPEAPCNVTLLVYEGNYISGTWFRADVVDIARVARSREFIFCDDESGEQSVVTAALWPVHEMRPISSEVAPSLRRAAEFLSVQFDGNDDLVNLEFVRLGEPGDRDAQLELDQLRRAIGMESYPRYSVLFAYSKSDDATRLEAVLQLLEFGIRVFLITDARDWDNYYSGGIERLKALLGSSILEVSVVGHVNQSLSGVLRIDGTPTKRCVGQAFLNLWASAEEAGSINTRQYEIVHGVAPDNTLDNDTPIVVTASAGSGKTETLTERILFLLCTSTSGTLLPDQSKLENYDLRLDEIVLITFTREAAREMRERLTRSLILRRRLSTRCSMPVLAWLAQLGYTNISTIHSFAKRLIQELGPRVGVSNDFSVGKDYDRFDEILRSEVDKAYHELSSQTRSDLPEIHEIQKFVARIWRSLVENGVNVLEMGTTGASGSGNPPTSTIRSLDWASDKCSNSWGSEFGRKLPDIIEGIASRYRQVCREQSLVPTDQLLSIATDLVRPRPSSGGSRDELRVPKYLFIDEFQDTDEQQIELALHLRVRGTRLFVVGDQKQAIYRFRGAAGDAFSLLRRKGIRLSEFSLVRNFRTDGVLLESMQERFDAWAKAGHLDLRSTDELRAAHDRKSIGIATEVVNMPVRFADRRKIALSEMTKVIRRWQGESWYKARNTSPQIAVLCRTNSQAIEVKNHLARLEPKVLCEISKGGDFFRCRAVTEIRALFRALASPDDFGASLELLETAWGKAILVYVEQVENEQAGRGLWRYVLIDENTDDWTVAIHDREILSWGARLDSSPDGRIPTDDVAVFRSRLKSLSNCLNTVPLIELVSEFDMIFEPHRCLNMVGLPDEEIDGYQSDLDHLLVLLDEAFKEGTFSIWQALDWLDLQAATNYDEEGPPNSRVADVLAITVHKSKGREFDAVVVPFSDSPFWSTRNTEAKVLSIGLQRRVGWRWMRSKGGTGQFLDSNMDNSFENLDKQETVKEETRLLYVAMTRAKQRLTLIRTAERSGGTFAPEHWGDLF
jgi:DNA helicase-2/ATP-dependent DNA helicase PcrA